MVLRTVRVASIPASTKPSMSYELSTDIHTLTRRTSQLATQPSMYSYKEINGREPHILIDYSEYSIVLERMSSPQPCTAFEPTGGSLWFWDSPLVPLATKGKSVGPDRLGHRARCSQPTIHRVLGTSCAKEDLIDKRSRICLIMNKTTE